MNNLTLAWTHGCIPAVSIVEGKNDVLVNLQETLYDIIVLWFVMIILCLSGYILKAW